uniref:Uncharacterized protein n=1 Tax=Schistocephalus solidus TaxID=70667 RepID=A0A0X3NYW0_SCHSO
MWIANLTSMRNQLKKMRRPQGAKLFICWFSCTYSPLLIPILWRLKVSGCNSFVKRKRLRSTFAGAFSSNLFRHRFKNRGCLHHLAEFHGVYEMFKPRQTLLVPELFFHYLLLSKTFQCPLRLFRLVLFRISERYVFFLGQFHFQQFFLRCPLHSTRKRLLRLFFCLFAGV